MGYRRNTHLTIIMVCLLHLYHAHSFFFLTPSSKKRQSWYTFKKSACSHEISSQSYYNGPVSNDENMEEGSFLEELGIFVMTGRSMIAPGRGLFIKVGEGID